ncbi:hypothetical protein FOA52_005940 [Chlamydomonas sp. UWO 241]|nr:hypothetical protein FOA52_005940 [Chlamydomonas sp. UWO 241]
MPLVYSVIARGSTVLCEHTAVANANANVLALRILETLSPEDDARVSYSQERYMFHCCVSDGIAYVVVAEEAFGRRIPFGFLEDVRTRFRVAYGDAVKDAAAYEYNAFSTVLAERMAFFSDPSADAINRVSVQVQEVKNIMVENIEKVLERGEKLTLLVDRTEVLQEGALTFRREARRVRTHMWWKDARLCVGGGVALVALLYFIVGLACGFTLKDC